MKIHLSAAIGLFFLSATMSHCSDEQNARDVFVRLDAAIMKRDVEAVRSEFEDSAIILMTTPQSGPDATRALSIAEFLQELRSRWSLCLSQKNIRTLIAVKEIKGQEQFLVIASDDTRTRFEGRSEWIRSTDCFLLRRQGGVFKISAVTAECVFFFPNVPEDQNRNELKQK